MSQIVRLQLRDTDEAPVRLAEPPDSVFDATPHDDLGLLRNRPDRDERFDVAELGMSISSSTTSAS
jgi:hypothetical protein